MTSDASVPTTKPDRMVSPFDKGVRLRYERRQVLLLSRDIALTEDSVFDAMKAMRSLKVRHLPVFDRGSRRLSRQQLPDGPPRDDVLTLRGRSGHSSLRGPEPDDR